MKTMVLLPLLGLAACVQTPGERARAAQDQAAQQQKLATALAGLTPGEPTSCIDQIQLRSGSNVQAYGSTLVYTVSPRLKYRTDTAGGCEGVGNDDILITSTPTTQLCRGDIARTVDRTSRFPNGSCSFGAFIPYRR
ncbi:MULTISPECIES: hypothetical protein [unclassified Sphingomonas]|uniref:hypothetical protein n=1 Tax=unclassified Sphingomonas TaxID=196159 RepID=UPI001F56F2F0|nr:MULTISPECIES: hypothetical protein [unclassified Sphingomonas]